MPGPGTVIAIGATRRRLLTELSKAEERAAELATSGIRLVVRDEDIARWDVEMRLEAGSKLSTELAAYSQFSGFPDHLLLELSFPDLYPADPPALRVVRPRLVSALGRELHSVEYLSVEQSANTKILPLSFGGALCVPGFSQPKWGPHADVVSVLLEVRKQLLDANVCIDATCVRPYNTPPARISLNVTIGLPTVAQCMSRFPVACLESVVGVFPELADVPPGRVVLPHSCATEVYERAFEGKSGGARAVHIEIKNMVTGGRAFVGLAEAFAPQDAVVFAPSWLLKQLFLREGDEVRVRVVELPLCRFVRLQPHSRNFYELVGSEPALALQRALAPLPTLTVGLSVPVLLPPGVAGAGGSVLRCTSVFVAKLEDECGVEVLAAAMPGSAGSLGEHEVKVDFLPAMDLDESVAEYKSRRLEIASRAITIKRLADETVQRRKEKKERAPSALPLAKEQVARFGDGNVGIELALKFPNGRQLRRRFPAELTVSDLKAYLLVSAPHDEIGWRPSPKTLAEHLGLTVAFPRRVLGDDITVLDVGDRSVVIVAECQPGTVVNDDVGADAVLYPATVSADMEMHLNSLLENDTDLRSHEAADTGGAFSASNASSWDGWKCAADLLTSQDDGVSVVPSDPCCPLSSSGLVSLGLTRQQFSELSVDMREAVLAAFAPCSEEVIYGRNARSSGTTSAGSVTPSLPSVRRSTPSVASTQSRPPSLPSTQRSSPASVTSALIPSTRVDVVVRTRRASTTSPGRGVETSRASSPGGFTPSGGAKPDDPGRATSGASATTAKHLRPPQAPRNDASLTGQADSRSVEPGARRQQSALHVVGQLVTGQERAQLPQPKRVGRVASASALPTSQQRLAAAAAPRSLPRRP